MSALGVIVGGWAVFFGWTASTPPEPAVNDLTSQAIKTPVEAQDAPQSVLEYMAVISAYSCDAHPANGMYPCGLFRDGSTPHAGLHGLVAAGPYEWLGRTVYVEGFGSVRLTDTPRNPWYGNQPHIDLFLSYDAAVRWGIQERRIEVQP